MKPSPCESCPKNTRDCSKFCPKWKAWFRPIWRQLRLKYCPPELLDKRGGTRHG